MPWLLLLLYGVIVRWDYSIEKVISSQIFEFKLVAFSIAHACQTERAAEPPLGRLNPDSCTRFTFMSPETWAQLRCNSSALLCFRWEVTVSSRASFLWKPSFKVQRIGIAKLCHARNKESRWRKRNTACEDTNCGTSSVILLWGLAAALMRHASWIHTEVRLFASPPPDRATCLKQRKLLAANFNSVMKFITQTERWCLTSLLKKKKKRFHISGAGRRHTINN